MMELSSAQHREMATNSPENMLICTKAQQERKPRPQQEQALKCPRCDSTNTKFCYYNNYSLTQPRYFCKSCRRYWTNGGTLRNVPVGGGCRKNKRPSSSKRSANSSSDTLHLHQPQHHMLNSSLSDSTTHHHSLPLSAGFSSQMMMNSYDEYNPPTCNDLSLVFARLQKQTSGYHDYDHAHEQQQHTLSLLGNYSNNNFGSVNNSSGHGFLEGLKANLLEQNNTNNFHNLYHGFGSNNGTSFSNLSGDQMMMIPYEDLSNTNFVTKNAALKQEDQIHHQLINDNPRSQVLWEAAGFPWHQLNHNNIIGGHEDRINNMVDNADLVRENANAFAAPVWHGLIDSPLM